MTGFRIAVVLQDFTGRTCDKKKCLIFLEDSWTKVADLEVHMKKVLGTNRLEVFVDDCWVSSEEPICIINPSDKITVRQVERLPEQSKKATTHVTYEEDVQEKKEKRPKKKKVERSPVRTADKPEVVGDAVLAAKKEELLMKVEAALVPEEMDVTDNASLSPPSKKRRHRKRPNKKRKELLEKLSVGATLLTCVAQQSDSSIHQATAPEVVALGPNSSHHIRFDETFRSNNGRNSRHGHYHEDYKPRSENTIVDNNTPIEDWQERLLAFTQERNKPVFVRNEIGNGKISDPTVHRNGVANCFNGKAEMNGDDAHENGICGRSDACYTSYLHKSVPTETAKANDLLYFKKLTVVDGQPQVSDHLLGLVEEVNNCGVVALKIVEGRPEQAFTPDEIQDSEDGCFVVNVDWRNVLEPRLIVDDSLLAKYL